MSERTKNRSDEWFWNCVITWMKRQISARIIFQIIQVSHFIPSKAQAVLLINSWHVSNNPILHKFNINPDECQKNVTLIRCGCRVGIWWWTEAVNKIVDEWLIWALNELLDLIKTARTNNFPLTKKRRKDTRGWLINFVACSRFFSPSIKTSWWIILSSRGIQK